MDFKELFSELIVDHWVKILAGVGIFLAGRFWGRWKARKSWDRKEFFNYMCVSLNTIYEHDVTGKETLGIRTILEKPLREVFLNPVAADRFLKHAMSTDEENSIPRIPEQDRWHYLNAVLNEVAEKFATGTIDRDLGLPTASSHYLLFLTREVDGDVRTHKPRAMLVRKDHLLAGRFHDAEDPLALERPHHAKRVRTLEEARHLYAEDPSHFLEIEILRPRISRESRQLVSEHAN